MAEETPLRVLVIISGKSVHWEKSWLASEEILPIAFQVLRDKLLLGSSDGPRPKMRLLAKKKYPTHIFLVFDISNTAYSPEKGHLPQQNRLPVTIVRLGRDVQAYKANLPMQNSVNHGISRIHNLNGVNSFPPFVEDHTIGVPEYANPRDPSLL